MFDYYYVLILFIWCLRYNYAQVSISECFDNSEYIFIDEVAQDIETANTECIGQNSSLSSITSLEENDFVVDFFLNVSTTNQAAFIGHRVLNGGTPSEPENYESPDGILIGLDNDNFGINAGEIPWRNNQPLDILNRLCVQMINSGEWQNIACGSNRRVICERSCSFNEIENLKIEDKILNEKLQTIFLIAGYISIILIIVGILTFTIKMIKLSKLKRRMNDLKFAININSMN